MNRIRAAVEASAAGHPWLPRALVLAWMIWVWLGFFGAEPPSYLRNPFGAATLIVHEAGHAALMWSGSRLWTVAGGTLFQLALPLLAAGLFWRQKDVYAITVALFWLGTSLVDAGVYAADARAQLLPRVSPWGGEDDPMSHDWTYMLMRFGKLSRDEVIGGRMRAAGTTLMPLSLAAGAWVLAVMARTAKRAVRSNHLGPLAILVMASVGCTRETPPPSAVARDSAGVRIVEHASFDALPLRSAAEPPEVAIGMPLGDARQRDRVRAGVVLSNGRIAVLDSGTSELRFYDDKGALVATQGGSGDGPGEYRAPSSMFAMPGDSLLVWDAELRRATVVAPDASAARTITLEGGGGGTPVGVLRGAALLVVEQVPGFDPTQMTLTARERSIDYLFSTEGARQAELGERPGRTVMLSRGGLPLTEPRDPSEGADITDVPFGASTQRAVAGDGYRVGPQVDRELVFHDGSGAARTIVRWGGPRSRSRRPTRAPSWSSASPPRAMTGSVSRCAESAPTRSSFRSRSRRTACSWRLRRRALDRRLPQAGGHRQNQLDGARRRRLRARGWCCRRARPRSGRRGTGCCCGWRTRWGSSGSS